MVMGCLHVISITAPLVALCVYNYVGIDRIQMDIAAHFQHPLLRINWFTIIPFFKDMSGEFPHILSLVMASSTLRSETVRARRKIFICTRVLQLYLLAHCCIIFCWSCDGYVTVEAVRLIVTFSVSTGCLSMSSVRLGNSAISSRNN